MIESVCRHLLPRRRAAVPLLALLVAMFCLLQPQLGRAQPGDAPAVVTSGDLEISAYWAKAMVPGQPAGSGYLAVSNKGSSADRLVAVSSPAAGMVEIHTMEIVNDVMTMRPVEGGLEIPAGATVALDPAGSHLMFMHVMEPFKEGSSVPLTLEFERTGKVEVTLPVRKAGPSE
jgi:copper(I)-binding protein